jgi:hypothetical protein
MLKDRFIRVVLALVFAQAAVCLAAAAQAYTPPPPPLNTLPPCPADKKLAKKQIKKNQCDPTFIPAPPAAPVKTSGPPPASQLFPYPGSAPAAKLADTPAAQAFPYPGDTPAAPANGAPATPANGTPAAPANGAPPASAAKQFPYPGDGAPAAPAPNTPAAKQFPYPGDTPLAPGAGEPASGQKPANTPAAKQFPYPGDPGAGAGSSSGSSSSSPDGYSSSSNPDAPDPSAPAAGDKPATGDTPPAGDTDKPKLADKGSSGTRSRRMLHVQGSKTQTNDERVDEDLSVAHYYLQSGDLQGSYLRAQDAVKTEPDYAPTHFALAEAAKKLKKDEEALAEYKEYLKLAPDGDNAKEAEKALEKLH